MLRLDVRMVTEHEALVVQDELRICPAEQLRVLRDAVGQVAEVIDQPRDQHEEEHAERRVLHEPPEPAAALFPERQNPVSQPEHREPRSGIEADPLGGRAEPEGHAAEREIPQPVLPQPSVQAIIHQENEEHRVAVDRRDPCLDIVQESGCQQDGPQHRSPPPSEEPPEEEIHQRQHQDPDHGPREAPAEGRHAEEQDAEGQDILPERRMRDLIRPDAVQMFPGGSRVIDLVKIGRIAEIHDLWHEDRLVRELRDRAHRRDRRSGCVLQHRLTEPRRPGGAVDAEIARTVGQLQHDILPLQHRHVVLVEGGQREPAVRVVGVFDAVIPLPDAGKQNEPIRHRLSGQLEHRVAPLHRGKGLRRCRVAQIPERRDRVHHGYQHDSEPVLSIRLVYVARGGQLTAVQRRHARKE